MLRCVIAALLTALLTVSVASAATVRSGFLTGEVGSLTPSPSGTTPTAPLTNVLGNPGFETGALPPWTTNAWLVISTDAHSGTYCAEGIGNYYVRQDVTPVPVGDINTISMWSKQPEGIAFQAVDFYYGVTDFDEFLVAPGTDWTYIDMTSHLRGAGSLQAIRIWGYSGGGPAPDITRADDVVLDANVATPVEAATWGAIKGVYQ